MGKSEPRHGQLCVWHIPQIPGEAFRVDVENLVEAKLLLDALANYDLFQLENNIKPDYSNAGGLNVYDANEKYWVTWYSDDGRELDEFTLAELRETIPAWEGAAT